MCAPQSCPTTSARFASERGDQLRRIAYEELDAVGGYTARLVGAAIPAQVRERRRESRRPRAPATDTARRASTRENRASGAPGGRPRTDGGAMQPHVPRLHVEVLDSFELHGVHSSGDVRILGGYAAGAAASAAARVHRGRHPVRRATSSAGTSTPWSLRCAGRRAPAIVVRCAADLRAQVSAELLVLVHAAPPAASSARRTAVFRIGTLYPLLLERLGALQGGLRCLRRERIVYALAAQQRLRRPGAPGNGGGGTEHHARIIAERDGGLRQRPVERTVSPSASRSPICAGGNADLHDQLAGPKHVSRG